MPDHPKQPATDPALQIRQAMAALGRNDAAQAEDLLLRALAGNPDNADGLQLMGIVRRMQNRLGEAEDYYRRALARDPARPQVHHNLGNLLLAQNCIDYAIAEQREAVRLKSNYAEAHLGLALALSARGDHEEAEKSCRETLRYQPNYQAAKQALAAVLNELDRPKEAEQILRQMLRLGVPDRQSAAATEHNLGVALKRQGRWEEALPLFEAARAKAPGLPAVDYNQGDTLLQLGRFEEARNCFLRALALEPDDVQILGAIALASAQADDSASARLYSDRALARDADHGLALVALAIADMRDGDFAAAEKRFAAILENPRAASDERVLFALGVAADALARHNRFSSAFALYRATNEQRRALAAPTYDAARASVETQRLIEHFDKSEIWARTPITMPIQNAAAEHAFVLGFMRSGTTLLTTVLAGHPKVVAIDERELLTEPARAFLLNDDGLDRLATLDARECAQWQSGYWRSANTAGFKVSGKVFVDKMPFNSLRLPLIARLFPNAKVIFAIRDPRDVVLSCFRRRFDLTPYSFEFLRLEDSVRFYVSVMTLVERYREKLPLDILEHRYEDMITDLEPSLRAACGFIGIDWQDSMRDIQASADIVDRRSVSAAQVRRGLYAEAAGHWRRYREELAPVFPILEPWIERFGYPKD